jgi:hypothetical protein
MKHAKIVKRIAKTLAHGKFSTVVTPNQPDMIYVTKENGKRYLVIVRDLN